MRGEIFSLEKISPPLVFFIEKEISFYEIASLAPPELNCIKTDSSKQVEYIKITN